MYGTTITVGQMKIAAAQRPQADAHWRESMRGATATTFRADAPSAARSPGEKRVATVRLSADLTDRLKTSSRGDARALVTALSAAVAATLRAYTGDDDVLLGTPPIRGTSLARFFPLRVRLEPADSFRALLRRVHEATTASAAHAEFPVELVGPAPAVMIAVGELYPAEAFAQLDYDVGFLLASDGESLSLRLYADAARFTDGSAISIAQHAVRLLEQAMVHPAEPLVDLDLLLDSDHALLRAVNTTAHDYPRASLVDLFALTWKRSPEKTAVLTPTGAFTYAQLDAASARVAQTLLAAGAGADRIVGICAERSFEMLVGILGILRAGAAYLPLDPSLPPARIRYLLEDSAAPVVLVQEKTRALVGDLTKVVALDADTSPFPSPAALPAVAPTDAAYVIYTSGSTGQPKGVVVEHHSVVNRLLWMQRAYPIGAGDVILQKTPTSFDVSVWELFWWLLEGATVSLLEPGGEREPAAVVAAIERHAVTTMHFVPTMLGAFLEYVAATGSASRLASLKRVFASGEALGVHHVRGFAAHLDHASLVNLYGPTEATVDVSHHVTSPAEAVVSIGRPIDNVRLYVLDAQRRPRPVGMAGELHIAGVGLARGYWNRPMLDAERFVPGAPVSEARLYRTGDLARWLADGSIEYLGRNDFQVKLRGFRIELGEIEHRLRAHPAVRDAAVIVRASEDRQQHLLGYVITSEPVAERDLQAWVGETLPSYMVPERFTAMDAFPLSTSGKLDARALPEPAQARAEYVAPRTDAEQALAAIWAEVLGLERVGVNEGFFSLGGNSIHFVSVLAKARKHGLNFTFQQLFQHPSIEELLKHAGETAVGDEPPRTYAPFELLGEADRARIPPGIEDAYPMSMLQSGLIYQSEIMHGNRSYHDIVSYLIQGSIDVDRFRKAVRILVRQNPVFRTSYHLKEFSEYLQLVHTETDDLPLVVHDVRHLKTEEEHEAWYQQWFLSEQNRPFDWEKPGLVRLHVHVLRDDLYRYSISQHNSALDGWSMNQVHTQLFAMYYAMLRGEAAPEGTVENHLRNFIGLEQHSIHSEAHTQFWRDALADRPTTEVPRLRAEHGAGLEVTFQDIPLPDGLSDKIVELARQLGVPVKEVLLAAHVKVHGVLCDAADVITGYEHAGRPELPDADRALGVFLNTMPFRMKIQEGTWTDLIKQTYASEGAILPYRRYPMAKAKQDQRTTGALFETVFNFTHFYSLKKLKELPEFALLDVRAAAITEFPLRMEFSRHFYTDAVNLSLHYHAGVFDRDHIDRIGGYLVRALELMVSVPNASHNARPLLGTSELAQLAELSRKHPEECSIVDAWGNLAPFGSPGRVLRAGGIDTGRRGRWTADGSIRDEVSATPAPAATPALAPRASVTASGEATARVTKVWAEVLKVPAETLQPTDDFFQIGGNSLAALKVSVLLAPAVTLRDVMRCSRLGELAACLQTKAASAPKARELLVQLAGKTEGATATAVCIPYAGGNAVHFKPFADALTKAAPGLAVFGVELPGHDPQSTAEELRGFDATAKAIADEVQRASPGPYVLWGHCVGSALAVEVARLLRARGAPVKHLFLAAKLVYSAEEIQRTLRNAEVLTFGDIRDLYAEWSGEGALGTVGAGYEGFVARIFRHDSLEANRWLLANRDGAGRAPLDVPCTLVVADDDPATEGYSARYASWRPIVGDVALREIRGGGHYFLRTQPAEAADLVARTVSRGSR